jgi:hypothetical protein
VDFLFFPFICEFYVFYYFLTDFCENFFYFLRILILILFLFRFFEYFSNIYIYSFKIKSNFVQLQDWPRKVEDEVRADDALWAGHLWPGTPLLFAHVLSGPGICICVRERN